MDSTSLIREIQKGNIETSISLIKSGIFLDGKSKTGQSPLSAAARLGDLNVLKELINHKVDVKSSNFPLIEAIIAQHVDVVKFLVENGMNPKKTMESPENPLFHASKVGNIELVNYLLELGCDPNVKDERTGSTCLVEATKGIYITIIELLLQFGADVNQVDKSKLSPLHYAVQRQIPDAVKLFLNTDGDLELFTNLAASLKNKEILQLLIDSGFDINSQDSKGNSTLHLAIKDRECSLLLLESGVDIHLLNKFGENAMILAADHGHLCLELFMNGASLDIIDKYGRNLLDIALFSYRSRDSVEFLLQHGCTFLNGYSNETVKNFMKSDAYIFQKPDFDYQVSSIPVKDLLFYSIIYNKYEIFKDLIWKVNTNETFWGGNGLLHLCIIYVRNEMFYYLIKKFSVNYLWRNEDNLLPIDVAIKKGNEELTMKLCEIHGNLFPIDSNFFKCSRIYEDIWDQLQCWKIFKSCESCHDIRFNFH
jgi:ankyrin repeat protein